MQKEQHPLTFTNPCWMFLETIQKLSASVDECQWVPFFLHGGIQFHIFASCALPCQTPFCQTVPLLPSVTQQQNVTEYWWEDSTSTAIPPTSNSDIIGQNKKTCFSTIFYLALSQTHKGYCEFQDPIFAPHLKL